MGAQHFPQLSPSNPSLNFAVKICTLSVGERGLSEVDKEVHALPYHVLSQDKVGYQDERDEMTSNRQSISLRCCLNGEFKMFFN